MTIILTAIFIYLLALVIIGLSSAREKDPQQFIIGGRKVGLIPTIGALAAGFRDGAGIMLWVGLGYSFGYGGVWMIVGVSLALFLMAFLGARVREISIQKNYITVGQMIRHALGPKSAKLLSWVVLVVSALVVSMQIYVTGNMMAHILHYPAWVGIFGSTAIVGFYLLMGGYSTLIKSDLLQFFIMASFICVPFILPPAISDLTNFSTMMTMPGGNDVALFGIGFFILLGSPDIWQRLFSAKNKRVIQVGYPLVAPIFLILTFSLIFLGMGAKPLLPGLETQDVFFALFSASSQLSPYFLGYLAVVALSITMSTLAPATYLFSSTLLEDFASPSLKQNLARYIQWSRMIMLSVLTAMAIAALMVSDFVQFAFGAFSLTYILVPVFIFSALGFIRASKKQDSLVTHLMIGCFVLWGALAAMGVFKDIIWTLAPGVLMTLLLSVYLLFNHRKDS